MRIKSKYKDFYDHIGKMYGEDPSITYVREPLSTKNGYGFYNNVAVESTLPFDFPDVYDYVTNPLDFKAIVVVDRVFLIAKRIFNGLNVCQEGYKLYRPDKAGAFRIDDLCGKEIVYMSRYKKVPRCGEQIGAMLEFSKKVGAPVYTIESYNRRTNQVMIEGEVPILDKYGISKILDAGITFQNIQHFIGNVLRDNPDTLPPAEVDDKTRLVQRGFDTKISFRHRK